MTDRPRYEEMHSNMRNFLCGKKQFHLNRHNSVNLLAIVQRWKRHSIKSTEKK